jgi:hypothetical protein
MYIVSEYSQYKESSYIRVAKEEGLEQLLDIGSTSRYYPMVARIFDNLVKPLIELLVAC